MTGTRARPWHTFANQHERDSNAALIDRPPATTFTDVARFVWRRCTCSIARHARKSVAAIRTYRETR
jgi:hypothetical protein